MFGYKSQQTAPDLRNTGIECEFKDPLYKGLKCVNELTEREVKYCESHQEELDGQSLCYNHQKRYKDQKTRDAKNEGYESVKNYEESNPGSLK